MTIQRIVCNIVVCLCVMYRSKAGSLPSQLKQGLGPRDKNAPPTFLDFDFVTATSDVKMAVTGSDHEDDDEDDDDDDVDNDVRRRQNRHQYDIDSAAVDIGPAAVHS